MTSCPAHAHAHIVTHIITRAWTSDQVKRTGSVARAKCPRRNTCAIITSARGHGVIGPFLMTPRIQNYPSYRRVINDTPQPPGVAPVCLGNMLADLMTIIILRRHPDTTTPLPMYS